MTLEGFLRLFRQMVKNGRWHVYLTRDKKIRVRHHRYKKPFCPVTALCYHRTGKQFDVGQVYDAAQIIGLSSINSYKIPKYADCEFNKEENVRIRRLLLGEQK